MQLSTCRNYRRVQIILGFDLIYALAWIPLYKFVNVIPETPGSYADWAWRLFFGWMAITMFACTGRAFYRTFRESDTQPVYYGMLEWLSASILFCFTHWVANGVLGWWGIFWITLILRFFLAIGTALFIIDVRQLAKDDAAQNLQSGMQLSGSGSRVNSSFKCNIM